MNTLPPCPQCHDEYAYPDGDMLICPSCGHEWNPGETTPTESAMVWKDANGNVLQNGDTVTLVKDLKIKGSSAVVKVGTKVKNVRLIEGDHDIDCKIDGFGPMHLKSGFVKRSEPATAFIRRRDVPGARGLRQTRQVHTQNQHRHPFIKSEPVRLCVNSPPERPPRP